MYFICFCLVGMTVGAISAFVHVDYDTREGILFKWDAYKQFHGKVYSASENKLREEIYMEASRKITAHNNLYNRGLTTYRKAMNKFGDLDSTEFSLLYTGFRPPINKTRTSVFMASPFLEPPDNLDYRTEGYVTDVKNQGQCGSCWAFSVTGAVEGQHFKKTGQLVSLSEQNLVDCDNNNHGCNGGNMDLAFDYIKNNGGIDTEDSYPYEALDGSCRYSDGAKGATVQGYQDVDRSENALKEAVASIGPITVGISVGNSNDFQQYSSGVFDGNCDGDIDHAVLVVGYGSENGQDYWLVKNSWGTNWGEEGYIKMADGSNLCSIADEASYPLV